ncbi:MAG: 2-C-methyl-D-erythritol 2,4-cyclodiphosphate synthase [bacterium]|nr:2-C-methyl-D-erythritol 2,4-cyclodiphosphate synthase [bacterium]
MNMNFWSIILAGGSGSRLGGDRPKQYLHLGGKPLMLWALETFARHADADRLILVVPQSDLAEVTDLIAETTLLTPIIVAGGDSRQASVACGLAAVPDEDAWVAVHDAARPLFAGSVLPGWLNRLREMGEQAALVPVLPVVDTMVRLADDHITTILERESLGRVQTPQLFRLPLLRRAHAAALERGETNAGDDGTLVLALGIHPAQVPGDPDNLKITTGADLQQAERLLGPSAATGKGAVVRTGLGFDSHRIAAERPLILGGVAIPSAVGGLAGHSDADVLVHALMDALLGAAALGDIGRHFPDTDDTWRGADSMKLLARVLELLTGKSLRPRHTDITLVAEKPKLQPHIEAIRANLAEALELPLDCVSVKATTNEGMGALGRGEGMAAMAVATLEEIA